LSGKKKDAHNVLREQKKSKECEANNNCLPVPLHTYKIMPYQITI